ncbi:hypothetical protein FGO68_gene2008 [Halteria grandinella]|uniref:MORN repeat protein n=1 Tax=Halteria grandinella TaxID=5974 RepID=A0A8J8NTM2_HALGN|nr:hypothetical protein FGO68_gene2008 [Halteria grandinella]
MNGDVTALVDGVYYGQLLDGKRDGYGILYCTDINNTPWLYECHWTQGRPTHVRYTWVQQDNKWDQYEGALDGGYLLHGEGKMVTEDKHKYSGGWRQGRKHGQGRYEWPSGVSYEGGWENGDYHGKGRKTQAGGEYQEGEWRNDKETGVHRYCGKDGKVIREEDYK